MKIFPGGNLLCGIYPGGSFPGWELSWWEFSAWSFPGGSFPGWELSVWEFSGWRFPGQELSRWDLSQVGIFFGGSFPGRNCPVGIIRVATFRVGVFMLPFVSYIKQGRCNQQVSKITLVTFDFNNHFMIKQLQCLAQRNIGKYFLSLQNIKNSENVSQNSLGTV